MKKRLLSMLMAVLMIASLVPATALAANTGHDHHDVLTVNITKTANHPGVVYQYCNTCATDGDRATDPVIKSCVVTPFAVAKDICDVHKSTTSEVLQKGTCDQPEITLTYCTKCGTGIDVNGKANNKDAITVDASMVGKHLYTKFEVTKAPTCTNYGWGYTTCDKCGEPEFVYGGGNVKMGKDNLLPTALYYLYVNDEAAKSIKTTTAEEVAAKFNPTNPRHANNSKLTIAAKDVYTEQWVEVKNSDGGTVGRVASVLTYAASVEPTHAQTVNGYAVVQTNGDVDKKTVADPKQTNYLDPKVTGKGLVGDVYCPDCGEIITKRSSTDDDAQSLNKAHKMRLDDAGYYPYVDAQGNKIDGVTDTWYCTVCKKPFGGETIPYASFFKTEWSSWAEWNNFRDMLKDSGATDATYAAGNEKETYGYALGEEITIGAKAATCQAKGFSGEVYKVVNGTRKDGTKGLVWQQIDAGHETSAIAHTWKAVESKDATCTSAGWTCYNYYICTNVVDYKDGHAVYCDAYKGTVTRSYAKVNQEKVIKNVVDATCEHEGIAVNVCKDCGNLYNVKNPDKLLNENWVKNNVTEIEKAPHKAGELQNVKEATCTELGYTGDTYCKWCNIQLSTGKEIPMKDHTSEEVEAVPATCTEDGTTAGTKCSVCGTTLSGIEKDPAKGHTYVKQDDAVAATCTEAGKEASEKCSACDDVKEGAVIPAAGHKFVNGVCTECNAKEEGYNPFSDLKETDSFYKDILWAWQNNIVDGFKDDGVVTFQATGKLTRAQVVQMLWNANGKPEAAKAASFSDVKEDAWYAKAVAWAVEAGVVDGMGDGTFAPDAECTRAQFVKLLWAINGSPKAAAADFSDVDANAWYAAAVAWAAETKVTLGDGAGHFLPDDGCTRGEAAAFLHRAPSLVVKTAE